METGLLLYLLKILWGKLYPFYVFNNAINSVVHTPLFTLLILFIGHLHFASFLALALNAKVEMLV